MSSELNLDDAEVKAFLLGMKAAADGLRNIPIEESPFLEKMTPFEAARWTLMQAITSIDAAAKELGDEYL